MTTQRILGFIFFALVVSTRFAGAVAPTADELSEARRWAATRFEGGEPFFSFTYNGKPSSELLKTWKLERSSRPLDDNRTEHALTCADPTTGLAVRCIGVEYKDFPAVEWTLYFKNTGDKDTPILENIQALNAHFQRAEGGEFVLRGCKGDFCTADSYEPYVLPLGPNEKKTFAPAGGRPTNLAFPYYNLTALGEGVIMVVGWPGQWATSFVRDGERGLQITAGQELTHLYLKPGEEIRSPLMVLLFWQGDDPMRAQNLWRRWMIAHNLPRPGGKLPPVELAACSSHQFGEMINANTQNQIQFIDRYLDEGMKLDYWWMDAGWYWNKTGWPNVGTWEVDTNRFPKGLREISNHAHAKGVKTILWFEPERVTPGTWLADNHPEWLLGDGDNRLLNLGNPEAWQWLVNHVDQVLVEQGIDLYRQDFNIDPLSFWRNNDAPDRQGITENKYVVGYLAYWDELRRRHPDMLIDSCASGGRRNDLETLRRGVPLLRSDYIIEPVGNQGHTYGLASWIPYTGTGTGAMDPYGLRSVLCTHFTACFDMRRNDLNYAEARRLLNQWRQFAPCFFGDYYPLTPYDLKNDAWIAWQFDLPESGEGMIQAFRRAESFYESIRLKLGGLEPDATYALVDLDVPEKSLAMTGKQLREEGLLVEIKDRPGAKVITYKKNPQ